MTPILFLLLFLALLASLACSVWLSTELFVYALDKFMTRSFAPGTNDPEFPGWQLAGVCSIDSITIILVIHVITSTK